MKRVTVLFIFAAALVAAGCASWYLRGAEMADRAPANATATFTVPACANAAGQVLQAPSTTYYLADEGRGPVLYEMEANGSGARITNTWTDAQGRHFFVWVGNGAGWQYYFPNDTTQTPIRFVFDPGTYSGDRSTPGISRPVGTPSATCVMQRAG